MNNNCKITKSTFFFNFKLLSFLKHRGNGSSSRFGRLIPIRAFNLQYSVEFIAIEFIEIDVNELMYH